MIHQWWRDAVIYQIYPRSFADASGDGYGDLKGVISKLDYLRDLGVDAVWLSPFYTSPMADAGYDVADYCDIDPMFGNLADADELIAEAHARGLRIIVDLVPNHSSSEHRRFQAALAAGPGSPERENYLFRDGLGDDGELPPNNWTAVFGGRSWTRLTAADGTPEQWYLHLFDPEQPDWNWEHEPVRELFDDTLRFWLDKGVDGFRVDVAHGLAKAEGLPDQVSTDSDLGFQTGPQWDQDGVHEIYRRWRAVLDGYDGDRSLVAEAWVEDPERLKLYLRPDEMHTAFNFEFLDCLWDADAYRKVIASTMAANESVGAPTTWVLSNHDVVRHVSRLGLTVPGSSHEGLGLRDEQPDNVIGLRRGRAATLMMLALPGSAYLYQGEELGLPDHTTLPDDVRQDPTWTRSGHTRVGRDGCRVPLPWLADAPAYGFSPTGESWLPQPDSFAELAADRQVGVAGSTWTLYRDALALRRELGLGRGELTWLDAGEHIVGFDNGDVRVLTNVLGDPQPLPEGWTVLLASADVDGELPTDVTVWLKRA
ncbi:glycoside hydrolase family 13 protein [Tessaracoccus palaemonis]|uniref:Glycoside hydrolase family 13 protein n=1 Tax=Tessaracoccus palaemonis TaxID=2829499 RepID=A0ABX8SIJ3_9ACTN|nr:alpha-amylase family glycosyl hydrolase [Tessaracoccus palaemonis]QXT62282.1 glycoside hydrolase family 13 protein [Tessaracoccus palaemonis]